MYGQNPGLQELRIAGLDDLIEYLGKNHNENIDIEAIQRYRLRYGSQPEAG